MKSMTGSRGLSAADTGIAVAGDENRAEFSITVNLAAGTNLIEVLAANPYSEGRDTVEVIFDPDI
jgi:hypothetical protein